MPKPDTSMQPLPPDSALRALFVDLPGTLYLDSASNGPRLRAVLDAGHAAIEASSTPWRLSNAQWRQQIESVRASAACLFDGDAEGVALIPSAAFGLSIAARTLPLQRGDGVLVLDGQFPSNLLPWQQRCAEVGARLVAVERGTRDWTGAVLDALARDPRIRILALPQAYWRDGALLDLARIAATARTQQARLVLDLSQSLGALPVEMDAWQPDVVVGVGNKWLLGAPGLTYCWLAPEWRAAGESLDGHWQGRDDRGRWQFEAAQAAPYRAGARRYDAGGVCDPLRLAMAQAALDQVLAWGVDNIAAGLKARIRALLEGLQAEGLADWLPTGPVAHFCGLRPPPSLLPNLPAALAAEGIVATLRHDVLRIAPHLHVAPEDLRQLATRLAAIAGKG